MRQHCVQFNNAIQANFEPLKSPSVLTSRPRDATISYFLCYKPSSWCAAIQTSYHLRHCMLVSNRKKRKKTKKRPKKDRKKKDFSLDQISTYAMQCGYTQSTPEKGSIMKFVNRVMICFVIQHCNLAVLNLSVQTQSQSETSKPFS